MNEVVLTNDAEAQRTAAPAPTKVIPEATMLAVLNRCDETREFLAQFWLANPHLAKQGGAKVAALIAVT